VRRETPTPHSMTSRPPGVKTRQFLSKTETIANDFFVCVDDVRTTGFTSEEECWQCTRAVASHYNYLGIQDAPRKWQRPSSNAGPWAGSTVLTSDSAVCLTVTVELMAESQDLIQWIYDGIMAGSSLCHKTLESYRGFLVYISQTYPYIVPCLKGIHLTLDSWHPHRGALGWKLPSVEIEATLRERVLLGSDIINPQAPSHVSPVPQLVTDIHALHNLFASDLPPHHGIRPTTTAIALYGFGNALGHGFGTTLLLYGNIHYRHGQWSSEVSEKSSNYRELSNLAHGIEEAMAAGLVNFSCSQTILLQ
jgi:hypothetical protein